METSNENVPESRANPEQDDKPTVPKIGKLDDPFEYAPEKPEGNHWENLLRPLFEEDKLQCNIWKDEVSNLLIFAGLFSAVVTAFIIESYKSLQRDPNQDIIVLLSQIVDRLGNDTSVASSQPSGGLLRTFSPTSSIRINVFWFISLILSLTTVLVGITSLQWLREHQNYVNLTLKEQYAVFHMRKEALKKWQVGRIFTAMPLLLQSALVLFFTGMIDFLLVFGDITVVIPVTVVIGLTLIFLVDTTLLPTLQDHCLFVKIFFGGHKNIPVPCPYKSPTSNAARIIFFPVFIFLGLLNILGRCYGTRDNESKDHNQVFIWRIEYFYKTWLARDLQWLKIRDCFMRRAFNCSFFRSKDEPKPIGPGDPAHVQNLPIWDILQGLMSRKPTCPDYPSAYHAYMEVSNTTILDPMKSSAYLYDAVAYIYWGPHFINDNVCFQDICGNTSNYVDDLKHLARYQALFEFLGRRKWGCDNHLARLQLHKGELYLWLMEYLLKHNTLVSRPKIRGYWPRCIKYFDEKYFGSRKLQAMLLQLITTAFKQIITEECTPETLVNAPITTFFIDNWNFIRRSDLIQEFDNQSQRAIASLFDLMNKSLKQKMDTIVAPGSRTSKAPLSFYAAAMFARQFIGKKTGHAWQSSLETLLSTIRRYKELTIDHGLSDSEIEKALGRNLQHDDYWSRFSADWWSSLLKDVPLLDSRTIADIPKNDAQSLSPDTLSAGHVVLAPAEAKPHVSITIDDPTAVIRDRP